MNKNYIWFTSDNANDCYLGFGAGTSIERRPATLNDNLDSWLKYQDDLRFKMISLAIDANDYEMLDRLHARELPCFHTTDPLSIHVLHEKPFPHTKNVDYMIRSIANSDNTTLSYFFSEFDITPTRSKTAYTYFFPYAGDVLDALAKKDTRKARRFIEYAIDHNKSILKKLTAAVEEYKEELRAYYESMNSTSKGIQIDSQIIEERISEESYNRYYFYPENGFMAYHAIFESGVKGIIANATHMNKKTTSKDAELQFLINELTKSYNTLKNFNKKEI